MKKILISIEQLDTRQELIDQFEHINCQIIASDNPEVSAGICRTNDITCVVSVIRKSGGSGIRLMKTLLKIDRKIVFIFITPFYDESIYGKYADFPCKIVTRPFQRSELEQALEEVEQLNKDVA